MIVLEFDICVKLCIYEFRLTDNSSASVTSTSDSQWLQYLVILYLLTKITHLTVTGNLKYYY